MSRSTVVNNSATDLDGGGIYNTGGTVTVDKSTVSGNSANEGGGFWNDNGATVTITNSTVSGNTANSDGGGLWNNGTLTITNGTIATNAATGSGGGIWNDGSGTETLNNTIVVNTGSTAPTLGVQRSLPMVTTLWVTRPGQPWLLETRPFASESVTLSQVINTTLADNGGPTLTHALATGSPAIDCADNADVPMPPAPPVGDPPPPSDQRGKDRIVDGDGDSTASADIGAVESDLALTLVIDEVSIPENGGTSDVTVTRTGSLDNSLSVSIASSDATRINPSTPVVIPASQASFTFSITAIDNLDIEPTSTVTLTASATGFSSGADSVDVTNDDTANLLFAKVFTPNTIGPGSVTTLTFTISNPVSQPVGNLDFTDSLPQVSPLPRPQTRLPIVQVERFPLLMVEGRSVTRVARSRAHLHARFLSTSPVPLQART